MKCPQCALKVPKKASFCPHCSYELKPEAAPTKEHGKSTWLWGLLVAIIFFVGLGIGSFIFYHEYVMPTHQFVDAELSQKKLEYGDSLFITVTCKAKGMLASSYDLPIYIDGKEALTLNYNFDKNKINESNALTKTNELVSDVFTNPGNHVLQVGDKKFRFTVLTPAKFTSTCDADEWYYLTNQTYYTHYSVKNIGESAGMYNFDVSFMDDTQTKKVELAGDKLTSFTYKFNVDTPGMYDFIVDEKNYPIQFVSSSRGETGKIMENTVKGYGYLIVTNETEKDIVVYIVEEDSPTVAVAAHYIRQGDKHRISSIMHGYYSIIIQTGKDYVPVFNAFYYDEQIAIIGDFHMDTNVSKSSGGYYSSFKLDITPDWIDEGYSTDSPPTITE